MNNVNIIFEFIKFDSQKQPWPNEINPWKDGDIKPRDASWGWVNCDGRKIHILSGDYIVRFLNTCVVIKPDELEEFKEFIETKFERLLGIELYGHRIET